MAAVACPTWAEVNEMPLEFLEALNIVKGELNGDKYLWDHKATDPKTGKVAHGIWKSLYEKWTGHKIDDE